jgi:hypothetical protein
MKLQRYFLSLFLAGVLLGIPAKAALADDNFPAPMNSDNEAAEGRSSAPSNGSLKIAAADFCYRGSTVDPSTGEIIDLYVLCTEDSIESNLDVA